MVTLHVWQKTQDSESDRQTQRHVILHTKSKWLEFFCSIFFATFLQQAKPSKNARFQLLKYFCKGKRKKYHGGDSGASA